MKVIVTFGAAALIAISAQAGPALAAEPAGGDARLAQAQPGAESVEWVIQGLQQAGYRIVSVKSTFLGRIRILAENRRFQREVIVSRSTGVIFRDRIQKLTSASGAEAQAPGTSPASGPGSAGGAAGGPLLDVDVDVGGAGLDVELGTTGDGEGQGGVIGGAMGTISDIIGGG